MHSYRKIVSSDFLYQNHTQYIFIVWFLMHFLKIKIISFDLFSKMFFNAFLL